MKIHQCHSVSEAADKAVAIATAWGDAFGDRAIDIWFRGATATHDLLPSSYWRDADEWSSVLTFNQLVRNITDTRGFDEWDYYCLARHNGIPTRLLDWSEGFLQALFFAFDGWNGYDESTPCIWILRPDALNRLALGDDSVLVPGGAWTAPWLPPIKQENFAVDGAPRDNSRPIAVYPSRSNSRIISQLGTFTVHGTNKSPINLILESEDGIDLSLQRIDLLGFDARAIKHQLHYLGLRQSVIYPDADHIARDIGYMYDWLD